MKTIGSYVLGHGSDAGHVVAQLMNPATEEVLGEVAAGDLAEDLLGGGVHELRDDVTGVTPVTEDVAADGLHRGRRLLSEDMARTPGLPARFALIAGTFLVNCGAAGGGCG